MNRFNTVIFDFDGTVADTGEGIFECIRYAVRMEGLPQPSEEELRRFIGPPLLDSFMRAYPEISPEQATQLVIHYRAKYSVDGIYKFRLYDGMIDLFKKLRENGIRTAIGSSKPETFIKCILDSADLGQYFDVAAGSTPGIQECTKAMIIRDALTRLEIDNPDGVLMIGDRKYDIDGAHEIGIPCAAVLFGYGSQEEFEEHKADYIVSDCKQLEKIILG
ncbi:MAG: HAD-IA family hydrolase [Clostridia bacterium]|nr:HAD-IA family hydrolase [Clostridia bacterium]